jgi:hypothetical protein
MRHLILLLVLASTLAACGAPTVQVPTVISAPSLPQTSRPALTAAATSVPAPTAVPTAAATTAPVSTIAAEPRPGESTALPAVLQEVLWQGLRIQYDSHLYTFSDSVAEVGEPQPLAAATLNFITDPCGPNGADCPTFAAFLRLYPRDGLDLWAWLEQQKIRYGYGTDFDFVEAIVAGQPAAMRPTHGLGGPTYALVVGEHILLIGDDSGALMTRQLEVLNEVRLAPGQLATTTPDRTWGLWADAAGGELVAERPLLYAGAFLAILAIEPQAVQVRTPEGLTGWIHAPVAEVLSTRTTALGEQARPSASFQAQVAQGRSLPLREAPRSTAGQLGELLASRQEITVVGVYGDWMLVYAPAGIGWVRWYYNGVQYVDGAARAILAE